MPEISIGAAVAKMRKQYPGLSISKVRYLEDRGLIDFKRSKGGYRRFDEESLQRLAEILRLQKEYYYPLDVIKERMKNWRPGTETPQDGESADSGPQELVAAVTALGLSAQEAKSLESFGLIRPFEEGDSRYLNPVDISIIKTYLELSQFGIEPRHLRAFVTAADRQALLYQQVLSPVKGRSGAGSEAKLERLVALGQRLSDYLCRRSVGIGS